MIFRVTVRLVIWLVAAVSLGGCTATDVALKHSFPDVVASPRDISATVVLDDEFRHFVGHPNKRTSIDLGSAQTELMTKVFKGLFRQVDVVEDESGTARRDLVVRPEVVEVQVAAPSDTYLNVFEVWIKYKLEIRTGEGELLDSWFMPAYGKSSDSLMTIKGDAIEDAAIVALRDAGAKLILDFYRIPAVDGWLARQGRVADQ